MKLILALIFTEMIIFGATVLTEYNKVIEVYDYKNTKPINWVNK